MVNTEIYRDKNLTAKEKANVRLDLRRELDRFEMMLNELKTLYEQHFIGVLPLAPEKQHKDLLRQLRKLIKAPFKSSEINYRLRMLEMRYQTFNSYWERVKKQREEGTYHRDVFRAEIREKAQAAEARAQTAQGQAARAMKDLFNAYKDALEKKTGKTHNLDYIAFQRSLIRRANDIKKKHGFKKVSFQVKMDGGRVAIRASGKK